MRLLQGWIVLAVAIALTVWLFPGIDVDWHLGVYLWIALVFAVVNLLLGPVLRALSLPITLVTLGLFGIVVNAILLLITDWLIDSFDVDGLLTAIGAGIVIAVVRAALSFLVERDET
jgi:putative membrane protein